MGEQFPLKALLKKGLSLKLGCRKVNMKFENCTIWKFDNERRSNEVLHSPMTNNRNSDSHQLTVESTIGKEIEIELPKTK